MPVIMSNVSLPSRVAGERKTHPKKDKKKKEVERNLNFPLGVRSITLAHMRE
jgi:hypothetical protein